MSSYMRTMNIRIPFGVKTDQLARHVQHSKWYGKYSPANLNIRLKYAFCLVPKRYSQNGANSWLLIGCASYQNKFLFIYASKMARSQVIPSARFWWQVILPAYYFHKLHEFVLHFHRLSNLAADLWNQLKVIYRAGSWNRLTKYVTFWLQIGNFVVEPKIYSQNGANVLLLIWSYKKKTYSWNCLTKCVRLRSQIDNFACRIWTTATAVSYLYAVHLTKTKYYWLRPRH